MIEHVHSILRSLLNFFHRYKIELIALLGFILLAVIFYYPLSLHLATRSIEDVPKDSAFNMWVISWGSHALTHAPWKFFDANMFYPYAHVLAWGDHLFSITLLALPLIPILGIVASYNTLIIACMALSGFTMFILIKYATKSPAAAFIAGIFWCISISRISNGHIQILALYWVPLILMYADKLRVKQTNKTQRLLAVTLFMQFATGIYIAIYTLIALAIYFTVIIVAKHVHKSLAISYAKALVLSLVLCVPIYLPSFLINIIRPTTRGLSEQNGILFSQLNPLCIPGHIWNTAALNFNWTVCQNSARNSVGILLTTFFFASVYLFLRYFVRMSSKPLMISFLLIGIYGVVASLGPAITLGRTTVSNPFFVIPYYIVPGYKVMRITSRWIFIGLFGISAFIGCAIAAPIKRLGPLGQILIILLISSWLIVEHAPFDQGVHIAPSYKSAPVYKWLSKQPGQDAISELPVYPGRYNLQNDYIEGLRTYFAAQHLRPRTGGAFSPFIPRGYEEKARLINSLGDNPSAIDYLRTNHIKYVILLPDDYKTLGWDENIAKTKKNQFDTLPYLHKVFESKNGIAYEIVY